MFGKIMAYNYNNLLAKIDYKCHNKIIIVTEFIV